MPPPIRVRIVFGPHFPASWTRGAVLSSSPEPPAAFLDSAQLAHRVAPKQLLLRPPELPVRLPPLKLGRALARLAPQCTLAVADPEVLAELLDPLNRAIPAKPLADPLR